MNAAPYLAPCHYAIIFVWDAPGYQGKAYLHDTFDM